MGTFRIAIEVSREHVVTNEELAAIWRACRDDDYGGIVRLLILTGQRRDEVGDIMWSELDLDRGIWVIPRERTKNGLTHEVPLSGVALEILRSIPRRVGRDFVFGEGRGGFSGWSKSKTRLDARIAKAGAVVRPWRLHDLRRTAATRLGELGTLPTSLRRPSTTSLAIRLGWPASTTAPPMPKKSARLSTDGRTTFTE
jgi:integrase